MANPTPVPKTSNANRAASPRRQRLSRYAALAMGLQSAIAAERGAADASGNNPAALSDASYLSSSTVTDTATPSPLDLPNKNLYTGKGSNETPEGSMPSTMEEIEQQRARDLRMQQTAESFVGSPIIPGGAEGRSATETGEAPTEKPAASWQRLEEEGEEGEIASVETARAAGLAAAQAKDAQRQQAAQTGAADQNEPAEAIKQNAEAGIKYLKAGFMNAGRGTFVGFFIVLIYMNAEVMNSFTLKSHGPPLFFDKLEGFSGIGKIVLTLLLDLLVLAVILLIIVIIIYVMDVLDSFLVKIFVFIFG